MPRAKWTDEIFDAFIAAKPDITSLLDEDLNVTNYSYEQWFRICQLYSITTGGTQEEMAARMVTQRDEILANINRKRIERDQERGVDILRVRKGQMEIQSTLGKHQKETETATTTKEPAANPDHKNVRDSVQIMRERKAKDAHHELEQQTETEEERVLDQQEESEGQIVEGMKELEVKCSEVR